MICVARYGFRYGGDLTGKTTRIGAPHLASIFIGFKLAHAQNSGYQALIPPWKEARTARVYGPEYKARLIVAFLECVSLTSA